MGVKKGGKREYIREILCSYPAIRAKLPEARTRNEQRRFEAVEGILKAVNQTSNAKGKIQLIKMVYFSRSHHLYGAAIKLYISRRTAVRWNSQIMLIAAEVMDLI